MRENRMLMLLPHTNGVIHRERKQWRRVKFWNKGGKNKFSFELIKGQPKGDAEKTAKGRC